MPIQDPTLSDFYEDMNKHANADYKRVLPRFVVECEEHTSWKGDRHTATVTVWAAVENDAGNVISRVPQYTEPEIDGNNYVWEPLGRERYEDPDEAHDAVDSLTTENKIWLWCDEHPYEGVIGAADREGE